MEIQDREARGSLYNQDIGYLVKTRHGSGRPPGSQPPVGLDSSEWCAVVRLSVWDIAPQICHCDVDCQSIVTLPGLVMIS